MTKKSIRIGKYEFEDEATLDAKIALLGQETDEEGNTYPTHKHTIVKLGFVYTEQPTYDSEGNELTPGVKSDKFHEMYCG